MTSIMCSLLFKAINKPAVRYISMSNCHKLKEIVVSESGNTSVVEGKYITSPREKFMVNSYHDCGACPVCRLGLDVKHTDVLILYQFVRSDGCMLPRRITGLCRKQQKRIGNMVSMAQKAGILFPPGSKGDTSKRETYKKFNTYFDESTIKTWT